MIIAFTDYDNDEVTTHLAAYAQVFIAQAGQQVTGVLGPPTDSSSASIQSVLTSTSADLFFFGHGQEAPPGLLGQDKTSALDGTNAHLLQDRLVCATCCHGIAALDNAVAKYNATVLGYDGELAVICTEPYSSMIRDCVLAGPEELIAGGTADLARQKIRQAFRDLARQLIAQTTEDQVASIFMRDNAMLIRLRGDSNRRIR